MQIIRHKIFLFFFGVVITIFFIHCGGETSTQAETETETQTQTLERLYFGTGEYSAMQDWHAILRFDDTAALNSASSGVASTPDATVNVQATGDASGVMLNFAHTLFVDESRDEIYLGSLFTTSDNHDCVGITEVCGSIAVIANASSMDGPQTLTRHIFGDDTQINQPHGIWVDVSRDVLYAANTFSENILVWDGASSVTGNTAPDRIITYSGMGSPVYVFVDSDDDRMFVAAMAGGDPDIDPSILIFNNVSTLDGEQTPTVRLTGTSTRLEEGNNQTTHNVWYDAGTKLLFVGHHINEILIYDFADVDLNPVNSTDLDLAPRVLKINEQSDDSDQYQWSAYGLFYLASQDRLYVAASYQANGTEMSSGPPQAGSPEQSIKIYDGISDPSQSGLIAPTREIWWDSGDQYYPAQPLWVQESE